MKPSGFQLPPVQPTAPSAAEVAWLGTLPTTAPGLSDDERVRVGAIRDGAVDPRVRARAQAVLDAEDMP